MNLIVGLGNPGEKYKNTKHNTGFRAIDVLSEKLSIDVSKNKFSAKIGQGMVQDKKIILAKPQTYMNLSGESIVQIMDYYKIAPEDLYVIYDDIDIDVGKLRIRKRGSAGTHNGMRNIIYMLQDDNFPRFRIGISKPGENMDLISYVITPFTKQQDEHIQKVLELCADAVIMSLNDGIDKAMNKYNVMIG